MSTPQSTSAEGLSSDDLARILRKPPIWRRPEVMRSLLIALVSTILVFLILRWFLVRSEGWASVQAAFLSKEDFKASFPKVWQLQAQSQDLHDRGADRPDPWAAARDHAWNA